MNQEYRTSLSWYFILSVIIHAIFFTFKTYYQPPPKPADAQPVEIVQVPNEYLNQLSPTTPIPLEQKKTKPKEEQIAETEDLNREEDPNAKFLSEHNQKAEKESRANQIDDFRQKKGTGGKGLLAKENEAIPPSGETNNEDNTDTISENDGVSLSDSKNKKGIKRDWKTLSLSDLSVGGDGGAQAATDDKLDGVDRGERTILSTREYKFYSYYHRIKELLRQYWKPYVEREITRMWYKGKVVKDEELTTKVLVLLDQKGMIQKISKLAGCGIHELDDAALDAFKRAAPFPNPPQGMIDPDGFVRINWDFILTTESGARIQWRTVGNSPR